MQGKGIKLIEKKHPIHLFHSFIIKFVFCKIEKLEILKTIKFFK